MPRNRRNGAIPVPREVEKVEKAAFDSLLIEVGGFFPGRRTIVIQGDGKYPST